MNMKKSAQLHLRVFTQELEELIGPLLVFLICMFHHLYFGHQIVSSIFMLTGLLSLVAVHAFKAFGLSIASVFQLLFLGWVALDTHELFIAQSVFSVSLLVGLYATLENMKTAEVQPQEVRKDRLWQDLFEARKEITSLYQEKELLECKLSVLEQEKQQFVEDRDLREQDIAKLCNNMREMAEREQVSPDARYQQLREQFQDKSKVLDDTRRELFVANEELQVLKRTLEEREYDAPDARLLLAQYTAQEEALKRAHEQEIAGYEHMIEKLLQELASVSKG